MDRAPLEVMIVDDELFARTRLRSLVQGCADPRCEVAGEAGDAPSALQWLRDNRCDVVLLDVAMPGIDGLQLAEQLQAQAQAPAVVFVTAHGEHALRAFELEATDYLTKPVRRERLQAALQRVARARQPQPLERGAGGEPVLVVSDRGRVQRVPVSQVLYLKAELKYVTLRTADGEWVLDEALGDLEQRLGRDFIRVHRNAVVALRAVRSLERHASEDEPLGWAVQLHNGERLAVSRRQLASVREALAASGDAS
ncbi:MAG: LytTR family DNA-binding domain-containing protein [Burkholderiaceae bacterium]